MGSTANTRRAFRGVALGFGLGITGLFLLAAASAHAAVWVASSTAKVFPDSAPTSTRAVSLAAARNEYEAAQIAVSGQTSRLVTVSWDPASDPLLVGAAALYRVGYVTITKPSTGAGSRRGRYPDPLLPAAFATPTRLGKGANAFYVQVHVPTDAAPGIYRGALIVSDTDAAQQTAVRVPVTLTVYDFGWSQTSLSTSFGFSISRVLQSVAGALPDTRANRAVLSATYYRFFADHGISPTLLMPAPNVNRATGEIRDTKLTGALSPYLSDSETSRSLFADTAFPLLRNWPWTPLKPVTMQARLSTYLDQLFRLYVANGWQDKGYLYVWDEPAHSEEVKTARLATLAHAISAPLGFRARVLLTDWPRTRGTAGYPANSFLFDKVDIWCPSVYHLFDSLPELARRHAAGALTWWYSYASSTPSRYPTFLIDEPLTHERVVPWVSWRYGATGFLYWGTTRWADAVTGRGYRDPYRDPVSYASLTGFAANGDASLIYPGYEPALGLNDPYAGPVSSLRLESIRDGIEDYEYLRLAGAAHLDTPAGQTAAACTRQVAAAIADYRYGVTQPAAYRNLPIFSSRPALYEAARTHLAGYIARSQAGQAPVTVSGTVRDAASGLPVPGARVSDGVVAATTDPAGGFTLPGVLPSWRLTVSHPLYIAAVTGGRGDDPALALTLTRSATLPVDDFADGPGFVAHGGSVAAQTAEVTSGVAGVRVALRGGGLDLRHLTKLTLRVTGGSHTLDLDTLTAF